MGGNKMTTTKFWIQANENGIIKNIPHTEGANYQFLQREKAKEFLFLLRKNNPDTIFRLVICKEKYTFGAWE